MPKSYRGLKLKQARRWSRRGLLALFLLALTLGAGHQEFHPSAIELAAAPYRYSLVGWEASNLPDKWFHQLAAIFSLGADPGRAERLAQAREYFELGLRLSQLERQARFPELARGSPRPRADPEALAAEVDRIRERRRQLQPRVEATIEAAISQALEREGLQSRLGGIFPPVDTVFSGSPNVLVVSPRDRIEQQEAILLDPGLSDAEKEAIEQRILQEEDRSALVERTGGVAVYPSVVSDTSGLHHAVVIAAHEWLHHWFFFRPLGRNFWSSPEMTTLNETAATIGGEELGDTVFTALTGQVVDRSPPAEAPPDPDRFDFNAAMRETRLRTEELLAQGKVTEAEEYLEERRQFLVSQGYLIRKLNQAYFAFHGNYATSGASISPIGGQLRELRERSASLGDFLNTVARFGSYREFVDYLDARRAADSGAIGP